MTAASNLCERPFETEQNLSMLPAASGPLIARVSSPTLWVGALCFSLGLVLYPMFSAGPSSQRVVPSPRSTQLALLSEEDVKKLPYPPDILPGGRQVSTPYGYIQVYEWGPETGERVLLVHGISTPTISLGDLAHELVGRGYRVMLFGELSTAHASGSLELM